MLKKIIKTHTARLDYVDITKPTFLRNAVVMNRQRRVIASNILNFLIDLQKYQRVLSTKVNVKIGCSTHDLNTIFWCSLNFQLILNLPLETGNPD